MSFKEETFVSPVERDTFEEARRDQEEIRKTHPAEEGWEEVYSESGLHKKPNGKWRAVIKYHKK